MKRRQRVDWDEEIRKTERIRRRGFVMSAFSFAVAVGVIFAVGRLGGIQVSVPRKVIAITCLLLGCSLFRIVLKRRDRLRREAEEARVRAAQKEISAIRERLEKGPPEDSSRRVVSREELNRMLRDGLPSEPDEENRP